MIYPSLIIESIVKTPRGYGGENDISFRAQLVKTLSEYGKPEVDTIGNIWLTIGKPNHILMVAHTDTVDSPSTTAVKPIHINKNGIMSVDENALCYITKKQRPYCLGADDGAGIAFNYCMIDAGIEATYLFTVGEERGCLGADYIVKHTPERLDPFTICMEVDRAGTTEIITHQSTGKCASDTFATALADMIGMEHLPSDRGVYTDNSHFNEHIEECVNIGAGYEHQHSLNETQDLKYLDQLFDHFRKIQFNDLPIDRDKTDVDCYGDLDGFGYYGNYDYYGSKPSIIEERVYQYIEENPEEIHRMLLEVGIDLTEYITME